MLSNLWYGIVIIYVGIKKLRIEIDMQNNPEAEKKNLN